MDHPELRDEGLFLTPSQTILLLERERLLLGDVPLQSPLRRGDESVQKPLRLLWDTRELSAFLPAAVKAHAGHAGTPRFVFVARRARGFDSHVVAQKVLDAGGLFVGHDTLTGHALESSGLPPEWVDEVMEHPHLLLVNNPDVALHKLMKIASGVSESHFTTLAVTGTNGKTSTVQILGQALEVLSAKPVLRLGTLGIQLNGKTTEGKTPTMPDFAGFLIAARQARKEGAAHIVMEATSHGLDQGRLGDWTVNVAVFTNLTQDHLDYHGDMESYLAAKALLFEEHLAHGGTAVINVSDPHWQDFAKAAASSHGHIIGFGRPTDAKVFFSAAGKKNPSARYLAIAQRLTHASGVRGVWTLSSERNRISEVAFSLPLLGDFQHENAAAAAASLVALGYPLQQIASALQSTPLIPGRLEPVKLNGDHAHAQDNLPTVVVDYAHTPDALEKTLHTCRSLLEPGGRLFCVFGCGGDRDSSKRPLMGNIAATLADACYVTSDNPRTEDPQRILSDIVAGVPESHKVKISVDAERSRAIAKAVADAAPSDLVVVAGKGHEDYQIMGTEKLPFSDVEEARAALNARAERVAPR